MNDVEELKRYVATHAESLGIPAERYRALFAAIRHDGVGPGSWTLEWSRAADTLLDAGEPLAASQYYGFARFPFVDGQDRAAALTDCVDALDEWRRAVPGIERADWKILGGRVGAWTTGLSTTDPRPLLLILGGIVSLKEQWAPVLLAARDLGLAGVVTEMPGVGENTVRYDEHSWRMLPAVLDALADRAEVARTYVMAISFSGHLALRAAADDHRVRAIITAGAPVRDLFTDRSWQAGLPAVTVDTLAHLVGVPRARLDTALPPFALSDAHLSRVDVPVRYVASSRDEIVPATDLSLLREHIRDLRVLEHDDVHGAPAHAAQTRDWMVRSLVELRSAASS
ncbi:alpha/beta hydrolase [Kutzneria sp. NPDC052558]|uniref:alpha/beta hydrolase n=1 Tax=Kutzneria sp. NPDC052558 TaxID=3364121 RepID=UPI0037C627BC